MATTQYDLFAWYSSFFKCLAHWSQLPKFLNYFRLSFLVVYLYQCVMALGEHRCAFETKMSQRKIKDLLLSKDKHSMGSTILPKAKRKSHWSRRSNNIRIGKQRRRGQGKVQTSSYSLSASFLVFMTLRRTQLTRPLKVLILYSAF